MKLSNFKNGLIAVLAGTALVALSGALHGSAPSTSAFDAVVTVLKDNILFTSFTTMIAVGVLIMAVVRMMTGQGNTMFIVVLGVLVFAFIGPSIIDSIATAMPLA